MEHAAIEREILIGRDDVDVVGLDLIFSPTSTTGILVSRPSSSVRWLSCVGSRCATTTKASPLSGGIAPNSFSSASSPPAEEPMPTMGKSAIPPPG